MTRSYRVQRVSKAKRRRLVSDRRVYSKRFLGICLVIGTGLNTFFGRAAKLVGGAHNEIGHLQMILAQIGNFCIIGIVIFIVAEILVM